MVAATASYVSVAIILYTATDRASIDGAWAGFETGDTRLIHSIIHGFCR